VAYTCAKASAGTLEQLLAECGALVPMLVLLVALATVDWLVSAVAVPVLP